MKYLFVLLLSLTAWAGPMEDTFGVGARNKALGGTGSVVAEDYSATFYNPSLLSMCRGSRLSLGYDYIHTDLKYSEPADQVGDYSGANLGFCLKPLNQVGIGVYSNFSMGPIEFSPSTQTPKPDFVLYGSDLKAFSFMVGAGYAPIKQFAIGFGLSMASGVDFGSDLLLQPSSDPVLSVRFPAKVSPRFGGLIGVTVTPLEDWRLALVYRSATYSQLAVKLDNKVNTSEFIKLSVEGFISYSPHQISLASSYLLREKWLFSVDATYYFWSSYVGPFLQIQSVGSSIVPPFPIATVEAPNFSNILVPRVGVEYNVWDKIKLRAGYSFRPTPAPELLATSRSRLVDAAAHRLALGAGYEFQLYQNIFLTTDAFFTADILGSGRGSAINTGLLIGAEYD